MVFRLDWLKQYKWLIIAFVLAVTVRLVLIYFNSRYTFQEDEGLNKLAMSLALGNSYGYEGKLYWGYPPGATVLYASMMLLFQNSAFVATRILQSIIDSFGCILIYSTSKELFNNKVGIISSFLYAIFLPIAFMSTWIAHDALVPFFTIAIFCCFILAVKKNKWYWFALTGLTTGISCYFQPTTMFLPIMLCIGYFFYSKLDWKATIRNTSIVMTIVIITILPWIIRNYNVGGVITPMRSAGWATIYVAFNEFGDAPEQITLNDLEQLRLDSMKVGHSIIWASKEYEEFYRNKVIQFVKDHPIFVAKHIIQRIPWTVFYKPEMGLSNYPTNYLENMHGGILPESYYEEYPQLLDVVSMVKNNTIYSYIKQYPVGATVTGITLLYILLPVVFSIVITTIYSRKEMFLVWTVPVYYSVLATLIMTINAKNKVPGEIAYIMLSALLIYYFFCKITRKLLDTSK